VYNCVLSGLAQHGMAAEADELLREMEELSREGMPCTPDVVSISCVCRAHAHSRQREAGKSVEKRLRDVKERYANGDYAMKPDTRLYNAVLTAYAQDASEDSKAVEHAERILFEMELSASDKNPTVPDLITFGSLCQAYGRSQLYDGPSKVIEICERVRKLYETGQLSKPDLAFYSAVISPLTKSKVKRSMPIAESLFRQMENEKINPDKWMYNNLLAGWSKSNESNRLARCLSLFSQMEGAGITPDTESHNSIIFAASRSHSRSAEQKLEDFRDAIRHFRTVHKIRPNSSTYSFFIKACRSLVSDGDDRQKLVSQAFTLCREKKLVSTAVLGEVFLASPSFLKEQLELEGVPFDEEEAQLREIPKEWCSNLGSRKITTNICIKRWR
jgi:pentatricopeptide repeat protein